MADAGWRRRGSAARRLLPLGLLAALGAAIVLVTGGPQQVLTSVTSDRDWLHGWVASVGIGAPLMFVLDYVALMTLSM
jgi:hypothetical protein